MHYANAVRPFAKYLTECQNYGTGYLYRSYQAHYYTESFKDVHGNLWSVAARRSDDGTYSCSIEDEDRVSLYEGSGYPNLRSALYAIDWALDPENGDPDWRPPALTCLDSGAWYWWGQEP
jgi:hypothetical protein